MKVTFLLPPVGFSGGNIVVAIYAKWLAERGHVVTLVSPPRRKPSLFESIKSAVRGRGWPVWSRAVPSCFDGLGIRHIVLDSYRPPTADDVPVSDVIVATWWETAEWMINLPTKQGARVYFIQGHEVFDYLPKQRVEATYSFPVKKVVISRWLQNILSEKYSVKDSVLVLNGVDREVFFSETNRCKKSGFSVGFLYHESSIKGFDASLKVINKLCEKYPDIVFYSFGRANSVPKNLISGDLHYTCSPGKDAIRGIYSACDVWLTTSRSEGFNLVAAEAMACGTPVVSTRTGWPVDVIDGENGIICNIDDVDGIFAAVCHILELSPEAWKTMSNHALETTKDLSWGSSANIFEEVLEAVVDG